MFDEFRTWAVELDGGRVDDRACDPSWGRGEKMEFANREEYPLEIFIDSDLEAALTTLG